MAVIDSGDVREQVTLGELLEVAALGKEGRIAVARHICQRRHLVMLFSFQKTTP